MLTQAVIYTFVDLATSYQTRDAILAIWLHLVLIIMNDIPYYLESFESALYDIGIVLMCLVSLGGMESNMNQGWSITQIIQQYA